MPTLSHEKNAVLAHIHPSFTGTIVDIGSGFGTMVYAIKKHAPKATVIGIEKALIPYLVSKLFLPRNVRHCDYTKNLPRADLYYTYLYPKGMHMLPQNLPLISLAFAYPGHKPIQEKTIGTLYPVKLYIYK